MEPDRNIFYFFANNFEYQNIYTYGFHAAQGWLVGIAGVLLVLAINMRIAEDFGDVLRGKFDPLSTFYKFLIVAFALALYFGFCHLLITFFNTIYGQLVTGDTTKALTNILNKLSNRVSEADWEFKLSDIDESIFTAFGFLAWIVTFGMFVFVNVFMRIAHGLLFSLCIFWGAIVLPLSVTKGFDILKAWRNICLLAIFWPIVDGFFTFIVASIMTEAINAGFPEGLDNLRKLTITDLNFILGIVSIVNLCLIATATGAPFVAQGLSNGTGNVSGLIGSFAAAGISSGIVAAKNVYDSLNKAGSGAMNKTAGKASAFQNSLISSGDSPAPTGQNFNRPKFDTGVDNQSSGDAPTVSDTPNSTHSPSGGETPTSSVDTTTKTANSGGAPAASSETPLTTQSTSGGETPTASGGTTTNSGGSPAASSDTPNSTQSPNESGDRAKTPLNDSGVPAPTGDTPQDNGRKATGASNNMESQIELEQINDTPEQSAPDNGKKQARRGAIINQNRNR